MKETHSRDYNATKEGTADKTPKLLAQYQENSAQHFFVTRRHLRTYSASLFRLQVGTGYSMPRVTRSNHIRQMIATTELTLDVAISLQEYNFNLK